MPTKSRLEQMNATLRKEKGGIKADRTKIKADLARVKKLLVNANKRARILRTVKAEITGDLRKSTRKVKRLEAKLTKVLASNEELRTTLDAAEKENKKMLNYARGFMEERDVLEKKVQKLEDDLARCKAQHG